MPWRSRQAILGVVVLSLLCCRPAPCGAQALGAKTIRTFKNIPLGLTAVGTEVALPPGQWDVTAVAPAGVLDQVVLAPLTPAMPAPAGRRALASQVEKNIQAGFSQVSSLLYPCLEYAGGHGSQGPSAFADLDPKRYGYLVERTEQSPFLEDAGRTFDHPIYFLIPNTPVPEGRPRRVAPGTFDATPTDRAARPVPRVPMIIELRPYVDDGKHWIGYSDGSTARVDVDRALLAKYNLTLTFVRDKNAPTEPVNPKADVRYALLGLLKNPAAKTAVVTLADAVAARQMEVQWALGPGTARSDTKLLAEWARARAAAWFPLLGYGDASILRIWTARSRTLYSEPVQAPATPPVQPRLLQMAPDEPRTADAFGILGGRAALRETLQMQLLGTPASSTSELPTIPISTLKGVDVKSLPFDRMLAGKPGGRIALADVVPVDRLFVYFAKPSAVFPLLDHGGDFLARAGSLLSSSSHDDNLKVRYLSRLALTEEAARKFLDSGLVTELAIVTPDLFLLDGTDITVVMRVRSPDAVAATLQLLGIVDLKSGEIVERRTSSGRAVCWVRQGDVLGLSTNRAELDRVLKLAAGGSSEESLGQSAEFRYMLTELPVKPETRGLAYLSDPFIRRMVGPALKIGQLRRMRARSDMTMITAGALLARLDGRRGPIELATLIDLGYVPRSVAAGNYRLQADGTVTSPIWGTPADMTSIDTASITTVTSSEAGAYQNYMTQYRQYWREYFDPIGMRLDDAPGGALELSTFILPLVDSQLYNGVRGALETREHGSALRVPVVTPEPIFQLSLNLTDESWIKVASGWSEMFSQYTGISPAIFDLIGPGFHIAVQDADPVIAVGSADIVGAFGGTTGLGGGADAFLIPAALSILTRPCKVFVELQDSERALDLLRRAASDRAEPPAGGGMNAVSFRQVEGRDGWIYTQGVPGIMTIRLGLEVQNGFLVFSNIPWSQPVTVSGAEPRLLNGAAMHITPDAVRLGLAGLFATQAEQNQTASLASMASLLPLLQAVSATPDEAASLHAALFGSRPLHPVPGNWVWKDGKLESSVYGSATRWKEPVYNPAMGNFGLFEGATILDLNMQFEAGGLRAVCRWVWSDRPSETVK